MVLIYSVGLRPVTCLGFQLERVEIGRVAMRGTFLAVALEVRQGSRRVSKS
jgi:hypothetical protein